MPAPVSPLPKIMVPPAVKPPIAAGPENVSGIRSAVANGIRAAGTTIDIAGKDMGVVSEQAVMKPVEAAFALGKAVGMGMEKIPFTKKYAGMASVALGFVALIGTQSIAGIAKAPGDFAADVTGSVADAIEGTVTPRRGFGFASFIGGSGDDMSLANQHQSVVAKNADR